MSPFPAVIAARRARFYRSIGVPPPLAPEPGGGIELLGVGSASDSLTTYPITPATTSGDWYVDPNAGTNGSGPLASPFNNLQSAINAASGGHTILVRAGTLAPGTRYNIGKSGLRIFGYGAERPILSGANLGALDGASRILRVTATNVHIKGFEVVNVKQHTDGASDMGTVVDTTSGVLFEDIWQHDCPGGSFYMYSAASSRYQDCVFWNNGDGVTLGTNTADGFVATGPGSSANVFVRCFTAHAPDDGFDVWIGQGHSFLDCVTYKTGYYPNGTATGDGGGFKCGGGSGTGDNLVRGNLAFENRATGVNNNGATVGNQYVNNTSVSNEGTGIRTDNATGTLARNNISVGNGGFGDRDPDNGSNVTYENNTWNLGITTVAAAQFADAANYDWSLAAGSPCISAGAGGANLGASVEALRVGKAWLSHVLASGARLSPSEIHGV